MKIKKSIFCSLFITLLLILINLIYNYSFVNQSWRQFIFPLNLNDYNDSNINEILKILKNRIIINPFNAISTLIFFLSLCHAFMVYKFQDLENFFKLKNLNNSKFKLNNKICFKTQFFHFLGDIEIVFLIWLIPLFCSIIYFFNWNSLVDYVNNKIDYSEPIFVIVIMIISSTRPILKLAENLLKFFAKIGNYSVASWWISILIIGPLLGSFITEPAAMTISAFLLSQYFYSFKPSYMLSYATIGLLFVNISVGGSLTHFAAPPVLMVSKIWNWNSQFMFFNFGYKCIIGIILSTLIYYLIFKKEFMYLNQKNKTILVLNHKIPILIYILHVIFLLWSIITLHYPVLVIGGFLFFIALFEITKNFQYDTLSIKRPILVGIFLAGLLIHGGLQQWWIEPIIKNLNRVPLFLGSIILTAFNDNAAITFLSTLVPSFKDNIILQKAIVSGAITGGGLTVIANAPNPAGKSILIKYFKNGLSPIKLFLSSLMPTFIIGTCLIIF